MRTQSPLSFIWFGSEGALRDNLDFLIADCRIDFWCYIFHRHEEEEKKDHFHVYMFPSRCIDTEVLRKHFVEVDPNNVKPIAVNRFNPSKWYDWYWYGLHDRKYLISKNIPLKKYIYSPTAYRFSDEDFFIDLKLSTPAPANRTDRLRDAVLNDVPFVQLVDDGFVPVNQYAGYKATYDALFVLYKGCKAQQEFYS